MVDEKWFGDDYLIIKWGHFLSEITIYRLDLSMRFIDVASRHCNFSGINYHLDV